MLGDLKEAVDVIEAKFGEYFSRMKWMNFGGGQKTTDDDYDVDGLIQLVNGFQKRHGVTVHMEPGAAIVKNAGVLAANVLDIVERDDVDFKIAILDMSFNAHMPDFLLSLDLDMPVLGVRSSAMQHSLRNINTFIASREDLRFGRSTDAMACIQRAAEARRQSHHAGRHPV